MDGFPPQLIMGTVIEQWSDYEAKFKAAIGSGEPVALDQVRLRAPTPCPTAIVCMAGNYMENGTLSQPNPISAFNKSSSTIIGDGDVITIPASNARIYDHEAELAIIIGKTADKVSEENAYDYIFGYSNIVDVSHRGKTDDGNRHNFFNGKSPDTFGPLGPSIVTADEVADPQNLPVKLWVQGDLRQDYNTNDMGHSIKKTIAWISWITTLQPGDVVACGTNHRGLGPLQDGDKMEIEVANFGKLTNTGVDAQKRSWPRETRAQQQARDS